MFVSRPLMDHDSATVHPLESTENFGKAKCVHSPTLFDAKQAGQFRLRRWSRDRQGAGSGDLPQSPCGLAPSRRRD